MHPEDDFELIPCKKESMGDAEIGRKEREEPEYHGCHLAPALPSPGCPAAVHEERCGPLGMVSPEEGCARTPGLLPWAPDLVGPGFCSSLDFPRIWGFLLSPSSPVVSQVL